MSSIRFCTLPARLLALLPLALGLFGCGGAGEIPLGEDGSELTAVLCPSLAVTRNVYAGRDWWGTLVVKNTQQTAVSAIPLAFDVPSGVRCDYRPSGWTYTQSGATCTYRRTASAKLAAGASLTLNYSTNSQAFSAATNVKASAAGCAGTTPPPAADAGTPPPARDAGMAADAGTPPPPRDAGTPPAGPDAGTPPPTGRVDLTDPAKKEIAMELVSSAENSSLDWRAQYKYIEDIKDGRGYTGGLIGFCSGTGDMLELVQYYTSIAPSNVLAKYLSALQQVNGTASHAGLDPTFVGDWKTAAQDALFQQSQDHERDRVYFNPAVSQAIADGLHALGQFAYYDSMVILGPGTDRNSQGGVRATAMARAKTPAQGGDEATYLSAYLDAYKAAMLTDPAHADTSRIDTETRVFLQNGNLDLNTPLSWRTYGDPYSIP